MATYPNLALTPGIVTETNDATRVPVSRAFGVDHQGSLNFFARIMISAAGSQAGGVWHIEHTAGDGVWESVGSEAQIQVAYEEAQLGARERFTLTFAAVAALTQAEGFRIRVTDSTEWIAVWFDIDANGTTPSGAWYTGADYSVMVSVTTGMTAIQVAQAFWTAIDADGTISTDYFYTETLPTVASIAFEGFSLLNYTTSSAVLSDGSTSTANSYTLDNNGAATSGLTGTTDLTYTSHGWATGDRVVVRSSLGLLPTALASGEAWVIRVDANTVQLAATKGGTAVDLTTGEGLLQAVLGDYTIRLNAKDSTDVTQLPLWPTCRVSYTGYGGTITVDEVWVNTQT